MHTSSNIHIGASAPNSLLVLGPRNIVVFQLVVVAAKSVSVLLVGVLSGKIQIK
jgi:hypothetical protein